MAGHSLRFAALFALTPAFANIGSTMSSAVAPPTSAVVRELPLGVTEIMRPLPSKGQTRQSKRADIDLTGQNCASSCGGVAGTGPNQVDCNDIIAALNLQGGATFTMQPYSVASWAQASCTVEFVQSTADTVTYTYSYLGAVASYLSDTCNAANGYANGRCIFDGREDAIWVGNTDDTSQAT